MILKDLLLYLQSKTTITSLVGNKIYPVQAPTGVSMPWVIVEIPAGIRDKISYNTMEGNSWARVTVDVGPADVVKGSNVVQAIIDACENYRGQLGDSADVFMTCGEPRSWAGMGGAYRYQVDIKIKYKFTYSLPS